jgi:cell division protease FtsH
MPVPILTPPQVAPAPATSRLSSLYSKYVKTAPHVVDPYSYTNFVRDVKKKSIKSLNMSIDETTANVVCKNGQVHNILLPRYSDVLSMLIENDVNVTISKDVPSIVKPESNDILTYVTRVIEILPNIIFILYVAYIARENFSGLFKHGKMKDSTYEMELRPNVTFEDVAGISSAKTDLLEVVDFLQNGDKYALLGAKVPTGILLSGRPGVGKTLLARAVAGQAVVPFISCSASEFMESFVGVGASRLRDLFHNARKNAPSILFIDEIDTIGKKRDGNGHGGHDEREQTLNQLLTLMDGFVQNEGVIVIAATNRPDMLDDALLRPGRFDRHIRIEMPDLNARVSILQVHTIHKPIDDDVNLKSLARITSGFSGADLANLCNEAAIYAARMNATSISKEHFDLAFDKITIGEAKPSTLLSIAKKRIISYHESGHALLGILLSEYDNVRKVSIVPRGNAGGVTYFEPMDDDIESGLVTRNYLENKIMVALAGRVAEEIVFGNNHITTGAAGDFVEVQSLARNMITKYGFSSKIGAANWDHVGDSAEVIINEEVTSMINRLYANTKFILEKNVVTLHKLALILLEKETLNKEELLDIVECTIL